jgi:magnesium transporter
MIVNSVIYQNGVPVPDATLESIQESLFGGNRFAWIGLNDPTIEELETLGSFFNLHPLAIQDAHHGHQRPKIEEYGNTLFVTMDLVDMSDDGQIVVGEVAFFCGANFVISIRRDNPNGFDAVRAYCEADPSMLKHGPGFILYALMDAVVDRYFPVLNFFGIEMEQMESQVFLTRATRKGIEKLFRVKQQSNNLAHAVVPLIEASKKLHGPRAPAVCHKLNEYFRDVSDHLNRINNGIESIRESINTVIQVNLSLIALEESDTAKKLASWAAIFAVISAYAGIWGMNFDVMPEIHWTYGYGAALLIMFGTSLWLYRRFKRKGWL